MSSTLTLSPVTRIEGHLAIHAEIEPIASGEQSTRPAGEPAAASSRPAADKQAGSKKGCRVKEAHCEGEMFRGIEKILEGRDPLDAQQITQRICGVCPISHGMASILAQQNAYGLKPTHNGRLLQNLIQGANYLQSHILHFYHLAALDFVDVKAILKYSGSDRLLGKLKAWVEQAVARKDVFPAAPFLPRYERDYVQDVGVNMSLLSHYVQALDMRRICHEMAAVFGARLPHSTAIVPGGCTQVPDIERVLSYRGRLQKVTAFIRDVYLADLLTVATAFKSYFDIGKGCGNFLCFGVFPMGEGDRQFFQPGTLIDGKWAPLEVARIAEDVGCSWYAQPSGLHPDKGEANAAPSKSGAYSWIKAPRYGGKPMEVGPLARVLVNYHDPSMDWVKKQIDAVLASAGITADKLPSVLGRHLARGLEAVWLADQCMKWLDEIEIGGPPAADFKIPQQASGCGLTEAPRGALGHWITIENYKIKRYQCIVPTTWNCSPRDDRGQPGPVEQALEGAFVEDAGQPIEVGRIVRSFDPCIACAVH